MGIEERAEDKDDCKVIWGTGIHTHDFVSWIGVEKSRWYLVGGLSKTPSWYCDDQEIIQL